MESLYLAIPDLHGRSDIAKNVVAVLETIQAKNVVFLGDMVDRKEDPLGVVRAISQGKERNPSWVVLQGNHESMALEAYEGGLPLDEENSIFKICTPAEIEECCKIFSALPVFYETDHLFFTHGGIDASYDLPYGEIPRSELLWTYGVHQNYIGKVVVRGHEIFERPTEFLNNIATQTASWCDNSPFCISILSNSPRERKLLGWIEVELTGTNDVNLVVLDPVGEKRQKVGP
ncbi:metallophosphoesterase [Bdellovibrio bacteriovorus]|uniref:metallophosphoesterase n=1 Tax=Bdellovibrio bacteriovorus TaxID=959 RepID=UPI003A8040C4